MAWAEQRGAQIAALPDPATIDALRNATALLLTARSIPRLRGLRIAGTTVPAILIGALGQGPDRRAGLEPLEVVGAEESPAEALDKIGKRPARAPIEVPTGRIDVDRRQLIGPRGTTRLSQLQVDLLAYLACRSDRPVPREELMVEVWGISAHARTRTIDMTISRLRKLIERDPDAPETLVTCAGSGYRYLAPLPLEVSEGLFGRQAALDAVESALAAGVRRITLVGPPGVGKTALAREIAARARKRDQDPALIELAGVQHPNDVGMAVAAALQVTVAQEAPLDGLAMVLAATGRRILVLDNAEHVVDGVHALATTLVARCPELRVLVTSQVPVRDPGELLVALDPLDPADVRALLAWRTGLDPSALAGLPGIDRLVERIDGLPLVVELVAARLRLVPAEVLADAEDLHLRWLGTRQADDPRHRSLAAALAWTWASCSEDDRRALTDLSVARGPLDVGFAAALLDVAPPDALQILDRLAERSLVHAVDQAFRILSSVRDWASTHGDPEPARLRHLTWVVDRTRPLLDLAEGPELGRAIDALGALTHEIAAAHQVATDPTEKADLTAAIDWVLQARGGVRERVALADATLASLPPGSSAMARVLMLRAAALAHQAAATGAQEAWASAARAWLELGRPDRAAHCRMRLAHLAIQQGQPEVSATHLAYALEHGDPNTRALADSLDRRRRWRGRGDDEEVHGPAMWANLEQLAAAGRIVDAVGAGHLLNGWVFKSLDQHRELVVRMQVLARGIPLAHVRLGVSMRVAELASTAGDYTEAQASLEAGLPYLEGARPDVQSAYLVLLATTSMHAGDLASARRHRAAHAVLLDRNDDPMRRQFDRLNEAVARLTEDDVGGAEVCAAQVEGDMHLLELTRLGPQIPLLRALAALCDQRPDDALEHLDALGDKPLTASSPNQRDAIRTAAEWMRGDDPRHAEAAARFAERVAATTVPGMPSWIRLSEALVHPDLAALGELGDGRPIHGIVRLVARSLTRSERAGGNSR